MLRIGRVRRAIFAALVFSSVAVSQTPLEACPPEIKSYNASGLLGFFDNLLSEPIPQGEVKPVVDNNGYLYPQNDSAPAPPASFGYGLTVSQTEDNAILTSLLLTVPLNATENNTAADNTDTSASAVACALPIFNLPLRTIRLGQKDDGTCTSTFPHGCARKILNSLTDSGVQWPAQGQGSSLSSLGLPGVCSAYAKVLSVALNPHSAQNSDIPGECQRLFTSNNDDASAFVSDVQGFALSTTNTSESISGIASSECADLDFVNGKIGSQYASFPFWNTTAVVPANESHFEINLDGVYDMATRVVMPIITLVIRAPSGPQAFGTEVQLLSSHLGCLKTTTFATGSRVSPELEPVGGKKGLSGGVIAGIVLAVVAGVVVVVVFSGMWCFRKKLRLTGRSRGYEGSGERVVLGDMGKH
jgi:hypothetical protein